MRETLGSITMKVDGMPVTIILYDIDGEHQYKVHIDGNHITIGHQEFISPVLMAAMTRMAAELHSIQHMLEPPASNPLVQMLRQRIDGDNQPNENTGMFL